MRTIKHIDKNTYHVVTTAELAMTCIKADPNMSVDVIEIKY